MDVSRRDKTDPGAHREFSERVVARVVKRSVVIGELDKEVLGTERLYEAREFAGCRLRPTVNERGRHRAVTAPGEDVPVTAMRVRECVERERRTSFFAPRKLGT